MGNFRRRTVAIAAILALSVAANSGAEPAEPARSVNISNSWLLPQNDFPVFYRHFKDRVTWFEADAVCQFHHAQLVTVESTNQFEAVRRYLKELDVIENVWIGLKRNSEATEFTWTNYQPLARSGYFREEVPRSSDPVCVVADPTANFKWHSLHCGGPEVASFVCELPVPNWASKSNGCMTNMVEGMTVTFLPEHPAIQLAKECSPGVSKNVTCKGNMEQSEIIEQLSCPNSNKLLKTLFKPVKSNVADVKPKTTTSSSESEVEDYVEMATIAQYNDETFQSISKVMGGRGTVGFPQEMSIAQEPIKPRGRDGFDTNGIDSAFIAAAAVTTSATTTAAVTASATTTTAAATAAATAVTTSATAAERREPSATTANAGGTVKLAVATTTANGDADRTPTTAAAAATTTSTAAFETPAAAAKTSTEAAAPTTAETSRRTTATSGRTAVTAKTPYTVTTVTSASVTWDPIRVYKKIDLPQLYDVVDFPFKPAPVTVTTAAATTTAAITTTAAAATTVTAATARINGTATVSTVTAAAEDDADRADSSGPTPTASYSTATGDNATASVTVAATSAASTATVTATAATATAAGHRKSVNYESYADDHPNRSRHIVRPKQQHHHSYPYILYRLLG